MQREKGKRGERELAAKLSGLTGLDIKRNLGAEREGGDDISIQGWSIECKLHKVLALSAWWKQAVEQASDGLAPALMWREHGKSQWWVQCRLDELTGRGGQLADVPVRLTIEDWVKVLSGRVNFIN